MISEGTGSFSTQPAEGAGKTGHIPQIATAAAGYCPQQRTHDHYAGSFSRTRSCLAFVP